MALNIQYLGLSGNAFTGCLPTGLGTDGNDDLWRPELKALPTCGPTFGEDSYAFTPAGNPAAGTTVGTITATAYETGDAVSYQITEGNDYALFTIDAATGVVTLKRTPNQEDGTSHTLTVQAQDGHGQKMTTQATVSLAN